SAILRPFQLEDDEIRPPLPMRDGPLRIFRRAAQRRWNALPDTSRSARRSAELFCQDRGGRRSSGADDVYGSFTDSAENQKATGYVQASRRCGPFIRTVPASGLQGGHPPS